MEHSTTTTTALTTTTVATAIAVAIAVAVAIGAVLTWTVVPPAMRVSAALLMSGIVFGSFSPPALSLVANSGEGMWIRARIAVASAINLVLLAMWREQDVVGRGQRSDGTKTMAGGGDGDGGDGFARSVLEWTRGLPTKLAASAGEAVKKPIVVRRGGVVTSSDGGDPDRDKILAESRARMLRASARDAAMKQLQMQRDAASSAGSRLLLMPLVLGAAAIVPIVMASRLMTKGDAEGFDGEEQITRQNVVKALAKALAISTVGIALVAWSISRGGFVAAWVCSIAVLLIAI